MNHLLTEEQLTHLAVKLLRENKKKELDLLLDELQPYDVAKIYTRLPDRLRSRFLIHLNNSFLADVIQELDRNWQIEILNNLGIDKKGEVLNLMDNDDLASLLDDLSPEKSSSLLAEMEQEESDFVKNILQYPEETAGRLMTNRFVWIRNYYTVQEAVEKLKSFAEYAETIHYLYVVDENRKLVGVVSYRDLILADAEEKIENIMYERVISVSVYTDQEEAARLMEKYDFLALPVVDENNVLQGIVTIDDMLDVIINEAYEDIEKLSATGKAIDFQTNSVTAAFRRLPWLILLLFIGILSGSIISHFQDTLNVVVSLAFFMPMISGMTGNTGTQSLAVVIRGLAKEDLNKGVVWRLIFREFFVGVIIGLTCGAIIAVIAFLWQGNAYLGLVVGLSLLLTIIIGTLSGTLIPLLLYRFRIDPAVASGPLITTLNDIFSISTYFSIATLFLNYLV